LRLRGGVHDNEVVNLVGPSRFRKEALTKRRELEPGKRRTRTRLHDFKPRRISPPRGKKQAKLWKEEAGIGDGRRSGGSLGCSGGAGFYATRSGKVELEGKKHK